MRKTTAFVLSAVLLGSATGAIADFSVVAPDGRKVLLKDDGTWKYEEATGNSKPAAADKPDSAQAVLQLEKKLKYGPNCRFEVRLVNALPYEIVQVVPYFSAYRAGGTMHQSVGVGFQNIRPTDSRKRFVDFNGIDCSEIQRIQVVGGDRCEMGELNKFTPDKDVCLARIRVMPTDLVVFEK